MIKIHVNGGLGNQLFQLSLAILLIDKGYRVKFTKNPHKLFYLLNNYNNLESILKINSFNNFITFNIKKLITKIKKSHLSKLRLLFPKSNPKLPNDHEFRFEISNLLSKNNDSEIILTEKDFIDNLGHWKIAELNLNQNYILDGFWQRYEIVSQTLDSIRSLYKNKLFDKVFKKYNLYFEENYIENSVCVHIRGGDYVNNPFFDILNSNYYSNAIKYFNLQLKSVKFYIFFDDFEQLIKMIPKFPIRYVLMSKISKTDVEDFILMTKFRYYIISNSTFAWWASILSKEDNKRIIRPVNFFNSFVDHLDSPDMTVI